MGTMNYRLAFLALLAVVAARDPSDTVAKVTAPVGWGSVENYKTKIQHGQDNFEEYSASLRRDYNFRIARDSPYFKVDIRIDPCKNYVQTGQRGKECCWDTNVVACQNHPYTVKGGPDLQIGYFLNAHIPTCRGTPFEDDPNCGTFIEVHQSIGDYSRIAVDIVNPQGPGDDVELAPSFNATVLADAKIESDFLNGFRTLYMRTDRLCSGWYELWWVVRTLRAGPFVLRRVPFFMYFPSCAVPQYTNQDEQSTQDSFSLG
eukprot:GEMP01052398.1.p1 GENE.GEMP01052398.1~~GEMP01052398.1.p1  ORF type:complete len:260 (+),score=46.38 GEMP01052398.1:117-896(+)